MNKETHLYSMCGEISWESASKFIDDIYENYLLDKFNKLVLLITSPGGDVDAGWAIHTSLKHLGCEISTVANGRLYSAGIIVYLAGSKRYVYDESMFLFHPTTIAMSKDEERALYKSEEEQQGFKIDDKLFRNLLENTLTNAKKKDITRLTHKHKSAYVNAEEAVKLNLANWIIESIDQV